jgi:uncharacterized membrane protein YwaF
LNYIHTIISGSLIILLIFLYKTKNNILLYQILKYSLIFNFLSFNGYLIINGLFDYKVHLPLHLCYLTELVIFISILFNSKFLYGWLTLNALGGGITGFTNSNLLDDALLIEHVHLYLSHFNLLLFSVTVYINRLVILKSTLIKSFIFNAVIFFSVYYYNSLYNTNYWFTHQKPSGVNLTQLLPDWPYYLLCLIAIGITSYYFTFKIYTKRI